jgi:hypothetical protein
VATIVVGGNNLFVALTIRDTCRTIPYKVGTICLLIVESDAILSHVIPRIAALTLDPKCLEARR